VSDGLGLRLQFELYGLDFFAGLVAETRCTPRNPLLDIGLSVRGARIIESILAANYNNDQRRQQ
jgi:hypothetical protein